MSTRTARILYIEDNPDNRMLVKRVLEAEGYQLNASHVPVRIGKLFSKASRYRKSE